MRLSGLVNLNDFPNTASFDCIFGGGDGAKLVVAQAELLKGCGLELGLGGFNVTLTSPDQAITWRPVAEDGADLPELHRELRVAFREDVSVGETFDFEWTPQPGTYWFEVRRFNGQWMAQSRIVVER